MFFIGIHASVNAQSKYKNGGGATPATKTRTKSAYLNNNATTTASPDTTRPAPVSATLPNVAPTNSGSGITVRYDTTIAGGFETKPELSLRSNYAVDRLLTKDRKPLEYDYIREDDQVWSQFVWEEIDGHEKMNLGFMYPGKDDNGDQRFFTILLNAIKYDSVVAFSPDNDLFKTPLTADQVASLTAGTLETVDVADPVSGVIELSLIHI